ncbi:glycerophosphoryl diester phosphodiesterase membrane domain-containing protein [Gordonia terrae]|uniref:glycerophosphoryl diester phosphodiesterase membrane domain-containing protein n=1 Tax=Gordonia terrae TaxID=2055 RepID=UPI003F6B8C2D
MSDEWRPVDAADSQAPSVSQPQSGPQPQWGSAVSGPHGPVAVNPQGWWWPGPVPLLRPASVTDLLQRIFTTVFAAPRVFVGLVGASWLVAAVPLVIATYWLVSSGPFLEDPDEWGSSAAPAAAVVAVAFAQWIVVAGTLSGVAAHPAARLRAGTRVTLLDTWQHTRRALMPLLGWTALLALAVATAFTPAVTLFTLGVRSGGLVLVAGSVLLALVAVIPVAWLGVRTVFTAPAIVVDGLSIRDALGRSGALSVPGFWRTCGVLAVMGVLVWAAMATMMYPVDLVGSIAGEWFGGDGDTTATIASVIGAVLASIVVQPVLTVVPAVLYDEARTAQTATALHTGPGGR